MEGIKMKSQVERNKVQTEFLNDSKATSIQEKIHLSKIKIVQIYIFCILSTFKYSNPIVSSRILTSDNTKAKSIWWIGQGVYIIGNVPKEKTMLIVEM